jgi:hypothetical protein
MSAEQSELRDRSTPELLRELADQVTTLVKQEIDLAKAEVSEKGKRAGIGAGMFGGAGVLGLLALGSLTASVIAALATGMPLWLAALIVGAVYAAVAGVLALQGRNKVQEAGPPLPEQTKESVKEDIEWAKNRARSGRT